MCLIKKNVLYNINVLLYITFLKCFTKLIFILLFIPNFKIEFMYSFLIGLEQTH